MKEERNSRLLAAFDRRCRSSENIEIIEKHPSIVRVLYHGDNSVAAFLQMNQLFFTVTFHVNPWKRLRVSRGNKDDQKRRNDQPSHPRAGRASTIVRNDVPDDDHQKPNGRNADPEP